MINYVDWYFGKREVKMGEGEVEEMSIEEIQAHTDKVLRELREEEEEEERRRIADGQV